MADRKIQIDYIYAGFNDPIQKITGDAYATLCGANHKWLTQVQNKRESHKETPPNLKRLILEYVKEHPASTTNEIADAFYVSNNVAIFRLRTLVDEEELYIINKKYFHKTEPYKEEYELGISVYTVKRRLKVLEIAKNNQDKKMYQFFEEAKHLYEDVSPKAFENDIKAMASKGYIKLINRKVYVTDKGIELLKKQTLV